MELRVRRMNAAMENQLSVAAGRMRGRHASDPPVGNQPRFIEKTNCSMIPTQNPDMACPIKANVEAP